MVARNVLPSANGPAGVLVVAALMFAGIAAWRFWDDDVLDAIGILYLVPIVLLAVRVGTWAGIAGAGVGIALTVAWASRHAPGHLEPTGYVVRAIVLFGIAGLIGREVDKRRRVERQAERWFSMSDELWCVAELDGSIARLNEAWTRHLGYAQSELLTSRFLDLCHPDDVERIRADVAALSAQSNLTATFEGRWRAKGGGWHWLLWSASSDDGSIYAAARDITERKQLEETLQILATEDPLTGLPNRRAWDKRLTEELVRARRSGAPLSVAMLDLDGLKERNDAQGHAAGDRLLEDVARSWQTALRDVDYLARVGGDEFAAIVPGCDSSGHRAVIERLSGAMPAGQSVSVGVATWDRQESAQAVIERADHLLYEAKTARQLNSP